MMVPPYHVASRPDVSFDMHVCAKRPQRATCAGRPTLALRVSRPMVRLGKAAIRHRDQSPEKFNSVDHLFLGISLLTGCWRQ
jgi:hypothetical protein